MIFSKSKITSEVVKLVKLHELGLIIPCACVCIEFDSHLSPECHGHLKKGFFQSFGEFIFEITSIWTFLIRKVFLTENFSATKMYLRVAHKFSFDPLCLRSIQRLVPSLRHRPRNFSHTISFSPARDQKSANLRVFKLFFWILA